VSFAQVLHRTWGYDRAHAVVTHGARGTGRDAAKRFKRCRCAPSKKGHHKTHAVRAQSHRPPPLRVGPRHARPACDPSRRTRVAAAPDAGRPAQALSNVDAALAAGAPSGTSDGRGGGAAAGWRLRWWRTSTERRLKAVPQSVHAWGRWRWCTTYTRGTRRRRRVRNAGCAKGSVGEPNGNVMSVVWCWILGAPGSGSDTAKTTEATERLRHLWKKNTTRERRTNVPEHGGCDQTLGQK